MRLTLSTLSALLATFLCLLSAPLPALASTQQALTEENLSILIVNSYDESTAPYFRMRDVFITAMQRKHAAPIVLRQFNLQEREPTTREGQTLRAQLLRLQYDETPPDLVVALGPPAVSFWLKYRDPAFATTPFIAAASELTLDQENFGPTDTTVASRFTFTDLVENILLLLPETSRILIVLGASAHERRLSAAAKKELEVYVGRIEFEYANDLSLIALQEKLASLPQDTAVLYGIFDSEVNGVVLANYTGLAVVRAASRAPVFGSFDDQLGLGIIGGRLIQLEAGGLEVARTAEELLGQETLSGSRRRVDLSAPIYDWRELQAWNIDMDRLPPGSNILFKPPSFWETYRKWVVLVAAVVLTQAMLLALLLLQRRRRRAAEQASLGLSRRLISAHEDERRRVARELHDDLSQRLARVSIDASFVALNPAGDDEKTVLRNLQPELVSISKDVHDMSYRLHPSLIDDMGIVAALQAECDQVRRRHKVQLIERIDEPKEPVPNDQALCIYRIAQEALHNAIKHAHADSIEVSLSSDDRHLSLAVHDNGVGFDTRSDDSGHGLGLSSMRERAHLVGGSLAIRTRPGQGTTVSFTVPSKGRER